MKNVFKKVVSAIVAMAMMTACAFTLVSCGDDGLGFKDGTIKIGATGPLTGDAASYGTSVMNGAMLAVKHVNEKGGIQPPFSPNQLYFILFVFIFREGDIPLHRFVN